MTREDELLRENAALRERLSRLSEASLRINDNLDYDAVLHGVLHSARDLTGAAYGAIVLLDDAGRLQEFLSSGMTPEEGRPLWPDAVRMRFFEYVGSIREPLRPRDFHDYARERGMAEFAPEFTGDAKLSFLAAPIRHGSEHTGALYVDEKAGDFTREDEEALVLFASQAALVIANAGRHREERRARADLETLIETSPVGVVVFDAGTGLPTSFNREARRIVDILWNPDQTVEELLQVVSFRRGDGREFTVREYPLAQELSHGEVVRPEETVISVPDGRSVTVLVNATPIFSDEGVVESVVVTMQDMAEVQELERLRAEFLAMVSHELRAPLTSIKGSTTTVLDEATELEPAVVRQFLRIIDEQADRMNHLVRDLLDVARIETGTLPVNPEPAELSALVDRARSAFISSGLRNSLTIDIDPDLPLVLADRQRMVQVLVNLLSNAARQSAESSTIVVSAVSEGFHVAVSVTDEGRGIPAESLPLLFRKFSQTQPEDQGGDTGLGLAICKGIVEAHGGRIWAESEGLGLGARFTFTLPTVGQASNVAAGRPSPVARRRSPPELNPASDRVPILAVDDDPQALRYIRDALAAAGYAPVVTGDPQEAVRLMSEAKPQLALLDLMLPGADGIELMQSIRAIADVPVIFISAYGREELIARAIDMGAVDYVVKPFSQTELAARIRGALRRRETTEPSEPYALGDLTIDFNERRVTLAGQRVPLMAMEYRLLAELAANAGRVMTYEVLLERIWGDKSNGDVRPMRTIISQLRRKLGEDADQPTYIFTETRVGYRMPRGRTAQPE